MSEVVFSTVAREIKNAMRDKPSDPELIMRLYDLVAYPANLAQIHVDAAEASRIMNRNPDGEVRKNIQEHALDQAVLENLEGAVEDILFSEMSEADRNSLIVRLTALIRDDAGMPAESRAELLAFAGSRADAVFVGRTLLYSFRVKNVPGSSVIMDSIQSRILSLVKGQTHKAQKRTCESLAQWLKKKDSRTWLQDRLAATQAQHTQLMTECVALFERERERMPEALSAKIGRKLNVGEGVEAMMLILLWTIFGSRITMLSFLYSNEVPASAMKTESPGEPCLLPHVISPNPKYVEHSGCFEAIRARLTQGSHFVFLQGMGGIGKTETAKRYAKHFADAYDTVVFAECNSSLLSLLNDNTVFTLTTPFRSERLPGADGVTESDQEYYQRKLAALRRAVSERTLLILDNVDTQDPSLQDLLTGVCHVIITTRWQSQLIYPEETMSLEFADDPEQSMKIFSAHYGQDMHGDSYVQKIIAYFSGHILALELIAKQMRASECSPEEMWRIIREQSADELEEGFLLPNKSRSIRSMTDHIREIFNLTQLNEEERYIMSCMSLLPKSGLQKRYVRNHCGCKSFTALNSLIRRSWLRELDGVITVHTLIKETVDLVCQPSLVSCYDFFDRMIRARSAVYCYYAKFAEKIELYNIASHIYESCPEPERATAGFYEWAELVFSHCNQPLAALEAANKLYALYLRELGSDHFDTTHMLCRIACDERSCNRIARAAELLEQGRAYMKAHYAQRLAEKKYDEILYLSDVDLILSDLYLVQYGHSGDPALLEQADETSRELIEIRHMLRPFYANAQLKSCVCAFHNLAKSALRRGDPDAAESYLHEAEEDYSFCPSGIYMYYIDYGKAELAIARGNDPLAISFLEEAFSYRGEYFGSGISGDTTANFVELQIMLGRLYEKTGAPEKAAGVYTALLESIQPLAFYSKESRTVAEYLERVRQIIPKA